MRQTTPALDLTVLFNGFKPLFAALNPEDVNAFAMEIIKTLQGEAGNINSLLSHTASLTTTLADRDEVIGRTIDNLNAVLGTVDERDRQLSTLLLELQRFVSGLAEDREAIGASLTNIAGLAESTAGLVKDARPAIREDVRELGEVTKNLDDSKEVVAGTLQRLPEQAEHDHPDRDLRLVVQLLPLRLHRAGDPVEHRHLHAELPLGRCEVRLATMLRRRPSVAAGAASCRSGSATRS